MGMDDSVNNMEGHEDELTLYVMCGLPASGKSTWAEKISQLTGAEIVSSDQIRKELYGSEEIQGNPKEVFREFGRRIREAIDNGKSVIADSTGINVQERAATLCAGRNADRKICFYINTPVEECKRRNAERERHVPEFVYDRMLGKLEPPMQKEGFNDIMISENMIRGISEKQQTVSPSEKEKALGKNHSEEEIAL